MAGPMLRWQRMLLYSICIAGAATAIFIMSPVLLSIVITYGCICTAASIAFYAILRSRKAIPLRRERRMWAFVAASILAVVLSNLLRIPSAGFYAHSPLGLPLSDYVAFVSYGLIWTAILLCSGKLPRDRWGQLTLWWDFLLIFWSSAIIVTQLVAFGGSGWAMRPSGWQASYLIHVCFGLITCCLVTVVLFRNAPRAMHGARGLLVIGFLLTTLGLIGSTFAAAGNLALATAMWMALGSIGFLCYLAAARIETFFYGQRSVHERVVDPFPSPFTLLPSALLTITAVGMTLSGNLAGASHGNNASDLLNLGVLLTLIVIRHLLANEHHRSLHRNAQQLYTEMAQHATTDPLTNLANHRLFTERMQKEMRRAMRYHRPLSLIFCDLDHFKQINDTYGHTAGDHALCMMAECLQREVRDTDLVARYGGEEFVVLLPETAADQANQLAERLRVAVQDLPIPLRQGGTIRLTISCGVSSFPVNCDSTEGLLLTADHAMYRAKAEGRNRVSAAPLRPFLSPADRR